MKLVKTVIAKVYQPTKCKYKALERLWREWKNALSLERNYNVLREKTSLPSYYCREINWKIKRGADAPVVIPKDSIKLHPGGPFVPWFVSIPTPYGRISLPLRMSRRHQQLLDEYEICDSQLIKRNKDYYFHIAVVKVSTVPTIPSQAPVIAIDLGERVIATSVMLVDGTLRSPGFHGKEVRSIRRHYAWLRKQLGRRKLLKVIKRIGRAEHRKVDYQLHVIAASLVEQAKEMGAVIALGDLTGIRRYSNGKRMNRIVGSMPFFRLTKYIEYKAAWADVPVLKVFEDYSSQECRICKQDGKRLSQGRFVCSSCGEYNADLNGAVNIGNRALAYMAIAGVSRSKPFKRGTDLSSLS